MLKVLKFNHVTMFGRDFDQILVEDDNIPEDVFACDLCLFKDAPSNGCSLIHECTNKRNAYWLLGACTAYPDGEANPNGRDVDP